MLQRMMLMAAAANAYDSDAQAYITAVETADGQALESAVRDAINAFVVGCKTDGIWSAIKASCILAGARTLSGALVPLVGTAPTNNNFVSADYNRKTGLRGNASNKWLNTNRNNNADPQNSNHNLLYVTEHGGDNTIYIGAGTTSTESGVNNAGRNFFRNRSSTADGRATTSLGLFGTTRQSSADYIYYSASSSFTITRASQAPYNGNIFVFAGTSGSFPSSPRASFYSVGEYLNGSLLAARVSTLMAALTAAIP